MTPVTTITEAGPVTETAELAWKQIQPMKIHLFELKLITTSFALLVNRAPVSNAHTITLQLHPKPFPSFKYTSHRLYTVSERGLWKKTN